VPEALSYTTANRPGWNIIAARRDAKGPQFFLDGNTTLAHFEAELAGDVQGQTMLHLACANGNDSLSWAVLGAQVTRADISDVAVGIAQETAHDAQLAARFIAADVYELPTGLGEFDIVYMSWGAICWMPDLRWWARIVRDHLKPGGFLVLFEHHPIWEVLAVRDGQLTLTGNYFGREPRALSRTDPAKQPAGVTAGIDLTSFVWPVSDVLASLADAGLITSHFSEGPIARLYRGLGNQADWLPAYYAIKASRPLADCH
jgi:SAM-dependent methyltransferase